MTRLGGARVAVLVLASAAAVGGLSCNVNDYCLNCIVPDGGDDGGIIDANGDAPDSSGPPPDACVVTGVEICDGFDNDCNGMIDDNAMQVGDACGAATPPCTFGTYSCTAGALVCSGVEPQPEECDNIDNNCNGMTDEGDPEGGAPCGSDAGECVAGVNRCMGGSLQCIGSIGTPGAVAETCDGRDEDCDGTSDEALPPSTIVTGPCGPMTVGECVQGTEMCMGGGMVCVGAVYPTFELCDTLDQDCDGFPANNYDLMNDPQNCGTCGTVCMVPNASQVCMAGSCRVGTCNPDFYDLNLDGQTPGGGNGCEFGPCAFQGPQEACNGVDDNCNNMTDEGVTPPPSLCRTVGACAGSTPTCTGATGWQCNYGPTVSTDGMGNIVPESTCDNIDNDCDGAADESHPQKNQTCNDGEQGVCTDFGTFLCNGADPSGPVVCNAVDSDPPPLPPPGEECNGLDDDCDGIVDNGFAAGNMVGQDWVTVSGINIMKYEAARPDASGGSQGTAGGHVCAKPGVVPWTNVTHPQAIAACTAIGARLCTEAEWQTACQATVQTYPINGPTGANDRVFLEAEEAFANVAGGGDTWTAYTGTAGYSGAGAMAATPNGSGAIGCNAATQEANSARLDFQVNITVTATYYLWIRMASPNTNDNSLCAGVDGTASATTIQTNNATWTWVVSPGFAIATTGNHRFTVYVREDATPVDAVVISRNNVDTPVEQGYSWAYQTNPSTAQPQTCNADPFDTDTVLAGDQDDIRTTGSMAACFANGTGTADVFDMSGNVKEWTAARSPGINALRGGASNNTVNGTTCQLDFTLADDSFFFPNAGFRCCR